MAAVAEDQVLEVTVVEEVRRRDLAAAAEAAALAIRTVEIWHRQIWPLATDPWGAERRCRWVGHPRS